MLTASCLQGNTVLYENLKKAVKHIAWKAVEGANGDFRAARKAAHVQNIFNQLKENGIEVDMQTVGAIYNEVLPKSYTQFMSDKSVERYSKRNWQRAVYRAAKLKQSFRNLRIGEQASERYLVTGLLNMFRKVYAPDQETKSMMVKMQEIIWKAMQRELKMPQTGVAKDNAGWQDLLQKYVEQKQLGTTDVNGDLTNLQDLFNATRAVLEETYGSMEDAIRKKGGDPATLANFHQMVDALNSSAMTLFFSRADAKKVLYDMFKKEGYGKTLANGKTIIDWNKLAGDNRTIAHLRSTVDAIMSKNNYARDVIEAVKDSLQNEFADLHAKNMSKQINSTKTIANAAIASLKEDPDVTRFLGGKTMEQWFKDTKLPNGATIENVEQVEAAVNQALAGKEYLAGVRSKIIAGFQDYFTRTYGRVMQREAQEAMNKMGIDAAVPRDKPNKTAPPKTGKSALQWIKENGIRNKGQLQKKLEAEFANRNITGPAARQIRRELARILDADNRARNALAGRIKTQRRAEERKKTNIRVTKNEMERLAEYINLGGHFEKVNESLLNSIAGVSELEQKDLDDINAIGTAAGDIYKELRDKYGKGSDMYAGRAMQVLQQRMNAIVARNANNRTTLNRVVTQMKRFQDAVNIGLLSKVFSLLRNIFSGQWAAAASVFTGERKSTAFNRKQTFGKRGREIFNAALRDVTHNGIPYGQRISDFAPQTNFLEDKTFGWDKSKGVLSNAYKNVIAALYTPSTFGLSAMDSANLVTGMNNHFNHAVYQALMDHGQFANEDEVLRFMNQSLNGQSWEDAKVQARDIWERMEAKLPASQRQKVTDAGVILLANDLVKANLNAGGIDNEVITAAINSAHDVAGYGLGHTANNALSRWVQTGRKNMREREKRLIKSQQWDKLAWTRFGHLVWETFGIRFLGGGTNWMILTAQKAWVAPAIYTGVKGQWKRKDTKVKSVNRDTGEITFRTPTEVREHMTEMMNARAALTRGILGFGTTLAWYIMSGILENAMGSDEDKRKIKKIEDALERFKEAGGDPQDLAGLDEYNALKAKNTIEGLTKDNYLARQVFNSVMPEPLLLRFYMDTSPTKFAGAINYIKNTTGVRYNWANKIATASQQEANGDTPAALGTLSTIIGDKLGVPLWRQWKDNYQLIAPLWGQEYTGQVWQQPTGILEGMFGGGFMQDFGKYTNLYTPNPSITILDGIGGKTYDKFKAMGIESMEDLRDHPGWEQFLSGENKRKAMEGYKKFADQTWEKK